MKIYLASRYSRYLEMQRVAIELERMGHIVTSRWITGDHQISDDGLSAEAKEAERIRFATEDFSDLMEAEVCISFTETPRSTNSRGGRHVEFGIALAAGKSCHIVGPRENVFHCLPQVARWETWQECATVFYEQYVTDYCEAYSKYWEGITAEGVRRSMCDPVELRKSFDEGTSAVEAAAIEWDAACSLG